MKGNDYRETGKDASPGIYKHYKGGLYRVLMNAIGPDDEEHVVYVSLASGTTYVRKSSEFHEKVGVKESGLNQIRFEHQYPFYAIYSKELGVYLGYECGPSGMEQNFGWSIDCPNGTGTVPTFQSREDAIKHMEWAGFEHEDMELVQVRDDPGVRTDWGTTREACVEAGLPDWKWKRVIMYSQEAGVYLGSAMGLGFWSKWDPVGQPEAVTFENALVASRFLRTWEGEPPPRIVFVPTDVEREFVTIEECEEAGLPGWDPNAPGLAEQESKKEG